MAFKKQSMEERRAGLMARFWSKVDKRGADECWLWKGAINNAGRAQFGNLGKTVFATRFIYEQLQGQIPKGFFVCHRCDVPLCLNPAHLFLGTPQDNVSDMFRKGRAPRRDGEFGASKLTAEQVRQIREMRGKATTRKIGSLFGICSSHVSRLQRGLIWTSL